MKSGSYRRIMSYAKCHNQHRNKDTDAIDPESLAAPWYACENNLVAESFVKIRFLHREVNRAYCCGSIGWKRNGCSKRHIRTEQ